MIFRWHVTLFSPETHFFLAFPCTSPRFGHFFERSHPLFSPHSLFTQRECFSDSAFPSFFTSCTTFLFPLISFPPLIHPALHLLPPLFSHSSPLFHLPPQLTHERAHPRALRAYAYTRTYPHVRRFSFITFTSSPTLRNPLCTNALGVKENEKRPSQYTQQPHNQYINQNHPILSTMNSIYHRGEPHPSPP